MDPPLASSQEARFSQKARPSQEGKAPTPLRSSQGCELLKLAPPPEEGNFVGSTLQEGIGAMMGPH